MNHQDWEKEEIESIKRNYKLTIEEACFAKGFIPKHIILDKTRNIHSYIVFGKLEDKSISGTYFSISGNSIIDLTELVKIQYSSLDRPLFFVLKNNDGEIISIEGNVIRKHLLNEGGHEVIQYIKRESVPFESVVKLIKMEL
jgi:hypothetical protein